ncbi:hypothetical protein BDN70DRAFT_902110 [Pholiota conissans]|uniref:Uncharacterized protein n=1 Tax=Pholiota conissans TaxID=109636 RepID=A0A9P5YIB7_9AGAR|nr:hypothetical protein BDN70DRAFT_902110 [Pholiota conissans]
MSNDSISTGDSLQYSRHKKYYIDNSETCREKARHRWNGRKLRTDTMSDDQKQDLKARRRQSAAMYREKHREGLMVKQRILRQAKKDEEARKQRAQEYLVMLKQA